MSEIIITISKDGNTITSDAVGFVGGSCATATKQLLESLGNVVVDKKKSEFYEQEQLLQDQKI